MSLYNLISSTVNLHTRFRSEPQQVSDAFVCVSEEFFEVMEGMNEDNVPVLEVVAEVVDLWVTVIGLVAAVHGKYNSVNLLSKITYVAFHRDLEGVTLSGCQRRYHKLLKSVVSEAADITDEAVNLAVDVFLMVNRKLGNAVSIYDWSDAIEYVIEKNDNKTVETHYLAEDGKITRRV